VKATVLESLGIGKGTYAEYLSKNTVSPTSLPAIFSVKR